MRNNKKVLKVTTSLLSGIFLASSITGNIYANNKVSFVEIMPNNEDIYFAVEEKGEDLVNIKLSAKKDVENISLKFMIDNKQYFYNYKSLKKDQEISLDVNPKELAKKILPVTSVVRKTEEINAVVGSHIIKGTISYSVDEENKEDKVTPEVNKEETKPEKDKETSEVNKEEGKETSDLEKEETAPDKDKETPELEKEETKPEKEDTVTPEVNKEENEKPKSEDDTKNKDEVEVKFNDINLKNFILEKLHNYDGNDEFEEDMNEYNFKLIDKNYRKDKSSDKIYKSDLEKIESFAIRGWDNEFEVNDLTGIENMVNLKMLTISSNNTESPNAPTAINNLEPLRNLSKLELLRLSHNAISDLTPLSGLNLKKLYLSHNMIENIDPLASLESLEDLDLAKNSISDYSAVSKLHNLKSLNIRNNKVTSLQPIKDLTSLTFLMANDNKITDISPLANMADLEYLYIDNNLISDFSILKNSAKLKHLIYNNQNIELGSSIKTNKKQFTIDIPYKGLEGISKGKIIIKAIVTNSSENKELDGITVDYDSNTNKLHFTLSDELFNNEEIKNLKFDLEIMPTNKYEYFGDYTTEPVYIRNINLLVEKDNSKENNKNESSIFHVKDSNKTLEVGDTEFKTRVFGENLTNDLKIFVKEVVDNKEIDSTDVTLKGVSGEKPGFKDVVLVPKENKTNADKVYKVYYGYGENASSVSSKIIVKPSVSNEVTKVVIPTILLNYNNGLVLEPLTFKIMEKDGGKFKEVTSEMSMLTEIEVEKNKEYTISLKANDKYTMVPLSFVVDNDNGEPKIVGSNDTLVQLDLSKKILTPIINDYTINNEILNSSGGMVTVEITGENLKHSDYGTRVRVIDIDTSAENSEITKGIVYREEGNRLFADINFPGNTSNKTKSYSLTIYSNLNQVFNKSVNRSQRAVISVLPANASNTDTTLSNLTINSYATNSTGAISDGVNPKHTVTATNQESKKTEVKLYGTNLKESVTKIRIFDTNGVEWPIFVAGSTLSGIYPKMIIPGTTGIGNGIVGNGNFQLLEVILPNELSTDMTYSYYISVDGSGNLVEDNKVTATVKAGSATSEKVNPEKRTITIKYQDEHGKKLKDDKTIVGYSWFDYTVEKDRIENYSFKNVKSDLALTGTFGTEDKEIILVYGDKTSVADENLATAEDKEKLNKIKNTKPAAIPNFREASEELRRLHALARLEATELLAKDSATKEEVNNLINKLQDIRNKIEKSGKLESNKPTVENSGVAKEETAEKDIEIYKDELQNVAVAPGKINNYVNADQELKIEYSTKRKEALKKIGNNEFTLEEIKTTIEELKVLKGKIENKI